MGSQRFLGFLIVIFMGFLFGSSEAYKLYVGGRDGWVLNPSENYTQWAHRNRFQVNDTLFFKYKKGSDSVLLVKKEDYNSCNSKSPVQSLTDGDSIFIFDHSGPFYFISGNTDNCNKGQKLHIVVMAIRPKPSAPQSPAPVAAPLTSPPLVPPPTRAESPGESPRGSVAPDMTPPNHSGCDQGYNGLFGLVLGVSIGVSLILGSFIGMV